MKLEKAQAHQAEAIMEIIEDGRAYLKEQGLDQWQDGYPNMNSILTDMELDRGYVFIDDGEIVGYSCVCFDGEPDYDVIDGAWLNDEPFAVIHRMAITHRRRGKGYGSRMFAIIEEFVAASGCGNIRIDTHHGNLVMQHLIAKAGYTRCGDVSVRGNPRIGFQKNIK